MSAMPVLFVGHGNPMNALADNAYTQGWRTLGASLPRPKAILCVSAHWYVPGTPVTAMPRPRTIHDFGGFPSELFQVTYPAPGEPTLARRVQQLLAPLAVPLDESEWGLDHGAWSVLVHLFPRADVPVIELGIDETKPASFHYDVGRRLGALRDEGILLLGSGNLVHNLHAYAWGRHVAEPYDWSLRFEARARSEIEAGNDPALVDYEALGQDARLAAPTPDHYLPLLYVLGARRSGDRVTFPVEGVDGGSISMLCVKLDSAT
jgi:4,5-DOPA dioxygenase extradiol